MGFLKEFERLLAETPNLEAFSTLKRQNQMTRVNLLAKAASTLAGGDPEEARLLLTAAHPALGVVNNMVAKVNCVREGGKPLTNPERAYVVTVGALMRPGEQGGVESFNETFGFDPPIGRHLFDSMRSHEQAVGVFEPQLPSGRKEVAAAEAITQHFLDASYPRAATNADGVNVRVLMNGFFTTNNTFLISNKH
jgi:hypothetical protein